MIESADTTDLKAEIGGHVCPDNSHCVDVNLRVDPRGYTCHCDNGFTCPGCFNLGPAFVFSCEDIDECADGESFI